MAGQWLSSGPVDIEAHYLRAIAFQQTSQEIRSSSHIRWYRGLVDSVLGSGSGESADSPYIVISVYEEYSILFALGLEKKRQSLLHGGIDAIAAETAEHQEVTIYFWPQAHWRRLAAQFPDPVDEK